MKPLIIGVGGTTRIGSSSELALRTALAAVARLGARTELIAGPELIMAPFAPERPERDEPAIHLVKSLRRADGIILSSPGYHGCISGLIKNALDYTEDMRGDPSPYFDGKAVGCIVCADGWQATGTTLAALRSIAHALRGWPTPLGIAVNTSNKPFDSGGVCQDATLAKQFDMLAHQMMTFCAAMRANAMLETSCRIDS